VAGKVSGLYVAVTAGGAVLVWSGWKGATLAATLGSLLRGNLNAPDTESVAAVAAGGSASGASSGSGSANYLTIAQYLVSNGYSHAGAAGVVGCIAGESGGNPEAKGDDAIGLIQWTGSNEADVPPLTGNPTTDLDNQLPAIIAYNNAQGSGLVAMLNAQTDPVAAADFYSQYFERPAVTDSDVQAGVATSVYNELAGTGVAAGSPPGETAAQKIAAAV
jgi:hypothetical protein